jgi:hypothetical protein
MKTLSKISIEGVFSTQYKPYVKNHQLTSFSIGKNEKFPSKIRYKARIPLPTFIQLILEVLTIAIRKKSKSDRKSKIVFADNMIMQV